MNEHYKNGPLDKVVHYLDTILERFSFAFLVIANVCLGLMLSWYFCYYLSETIYDFFLLDMAMDNAIFCMDVILWLLCCLQTKKGHCG